MSRPGLQSVAEFMRHPGLSQSGITEFYTSVVGLPVLRSYPSIVMLWAGEDLAFELKYDTEPVSGVEATPDDAQYIPIFRTYDMDLTRERLSQAGYAPVWDHKDAVAHTFYVKGPDGLLTGFQYRNPGSTLAADVEALRRRNLGPVCLEGIDPMPDDLQYMSRIVLRSPDVSRTSRHLDDVFGFDRVAEEGDSAIHALGDTVVLEVAPGGSSRPAPADRNEVSGALLLRVHDLDDLVVDALDAGAVTVGEPIEFEGGVKIRYFALPCGAVVGFVQRGWAGDGVEDREAARRWAERAAGR